MNNLFVAFAALYLLQGQATLAEDIESIGGKPAAPGQFPYFGKFTYTVCASILSL